ncbi:interleukin-10 receptor subunit alpha-like [Salvelinus fontinalis]|uniref:interleukin-10 receptor subunit alpha-like n=1 Tax=Salvelinus fontinalis TaxID=8038 RepID=UPI002484E9A7|nr:interleukin-10 receptor subunit alpha-like [Salvelinus fontinalis]
MDWTFWISILLISSDYVSGKDLPMPVNLMVDIWDGEVTLLWDPPEGAPPLAQYQVQMARYVNNNWTNVTSCDRTELTYCDLSYLIDDFFMIYKVRVRLVTENSISAWSQPKKFNLRESKLQHPSSTLLATSSSVTVLVHRKPLLKKIFPFGLTYTIYLQGKGQGHKTVIRHLKDEDDEDKPEVRFTSLDWGQEYCVSLKVAGNGGEFTSELSPEQCLLLPEQEWYILAVVSFSILSVMGVLVILSLCLCYFLMRPEKMPVALKSPGSGWQPLCVGVDPVEIVTDKGWFMNTARTDAMVWLADERTTTAGKGELEEGEDRRAGLDSGACTQSHISGNGKGGSPAKQEDSGCGSLGAPESAISSSSGTGEPLLLDGTMNTDINLKEDSGVGLGCQLGCAGSLQGEDCGILPEMEMVTEDGYRSQSPSSVDTHVFETEQRFQQISCETVMADPVVGYKSGHIACVCLGTSQCVWCQTRRHNEGSVDGQSVALFSLTEEQLGCSNLTGDICEMESTSSSYKKTNLQVDTVVNLEDSVTFSYLPTCIGESFPLLAALSELPLVEGGLNCSVNTWLPSLGDLEVTFD